MLKMCQSCKCHIRHSDCPTCHAPFTKKRDMPKTPSELERKYPSNIWSQILKKVQYVLLLYDACAVAKLISFYLSKKLTPA